MAAIIHHRIQGGNTTPLCELMQTLPQELYDEIYKLTFTAIPDGMVDIKAGNPFPHLLHVDRQSRERFAASHFASTTFSVPYDESKGLELMHDWFKVLAKEHSERVDKIVMGLQMLDIDPDKAGRPRFIAEQKKRIEGVFYKNYDLSEAAYRMQGKFRVQVWLGSEKGITTESFWAWMDRITEYQSASGRLACPDWAYMRATLNGEAV